jgi:hypothetical protein
MGHRQGTTVAPRVPESQGILALTKAPDNARGLLGSDLSVVGALTAVGAYECEILTDNWASVVAHVRASAVTGTVRPLLITRWNDGTTRDTTGSTDFVANTAQSLTLSTLNGQRRAFLTFSLDAAESVTFNRAEYNGQ